MCRLWNTSTLKKSGLDRGKSQTKVQRILEKDLAYQTSRGLRRKLKHRRDLALGFNYRYEANLGDIGPGRFIDLKTGKTKGRLFLLVINVCSKKIFAQALKDKSADLRNCIIHTQLKKDMHFLLLLLLVLAVMARPIPKPPEKVTAAAVAVRTNTGWIVLKVRSRPFVKINGSNLGSNRRAHRAETVFQVRVVF